MRVGNRPALDARHVDLTSPDADHKVARKLAEVGLVTFSGLASREAVLSLVSRLMTLTPHRDSDHDGLTTIRDTGCQAHRPGFAGFSSGELAAHTERSSVPLPPRLMLLVCVTEPETGGESLLADGQAVYADLRAQAPAAAEMLSRPRSVYFGGGDGHLSQVFTPQYDGCVGIRLRQDGLARWSPLSRPYLKSLQAAISRHQHRLPLHAGEGYLLDNHRWLHARTSYAGDRQCWRALGEPRSFLPGGLGGLRAIPEATPAGVRDAEAPGGDT